MAMAISAFSQLVITTNIPQNKYYFSWPVSTPNIFLYQFYHYNNPYIDRWMAISDSLITSDGTNYYSWDYIQNPYWPTNVDYQLRPSFSTTIVWSQATETNLVWYDVHFVGTGGLSYGKIADKSQTSMTFQWLDPTMLPWRFFVYKRVGASTNSNGWQYEIQRIIITTFNNNIIFPPKNIYIIN